MYKTILAIIDDRVVASVDVSSNRSDFRISDDILIQCAKETFLRAKDLKAKQAAVATYKVCSHRAA